MVEEETTTLLTGIINEEWKPISGYPNYEVSNLGNVRNVSTSRILKPGQNTFGYLHVVLCANNIRKTFRVHRLVATEFIDNPDNKTEVDHMDHNKQNNCINNLRWVSRSENMMNMSKQQKPCSSFFKGVSWDRQKNKRQAYIHVDTVKENIIGLSLYEIDAARASTTKALELFGEYVNLNAISDISIMC